MKRIRAHTPMKNKQNATGSGLRNITSIMPNDHHQPINVPTVGAQAFLMDYP
jgi:hypothetical protein